MDLQEATPDYSLQQIKKQVQICTSAIDACHESEAVVIATEWKEFTKLDWQEVYDHMCKPAFVFDGRLLVDADKLTKIGFKVASIGRGAEISA